MSLDLVNTLATLGTFLVISATAITAIVQLRHARYPPGVRRISIRCEARLRTTTDRTLS